MSNLFKRFQRLVAGPPLLVGEVIDETDELLTVEEPGGGRHVVRGTATVGSRVFFRGAVVEGPAPDLPVVEIEV